MELKDALAESQRLMEQFRANLAEANKAIEESRRLIEESHRLLEQAQRLLD